LHLLIHPTPEFIEEFMAGAEHDFQRYTYNQYLNYPAQAKDRWTGILKETLINCSKSDEWTFFGGQRGEHSTLVGCRISGWDKDHFGFDMAGIRVLFSSPTAEGEKFIKDTLSACMAFLKAKGISFASARIQGDDLCSIHVLEHLGFRYYENIIWPVLDTRRVAETIPPGLRLMKPEDLDRARHIASHYQYERGHFHCDDRFPKPLVNTMYAKWVETAFNRNGTVAVIESDDEVAGYFVYEMDKSLSAHLGYSYGRLQSLALDQSARGKGLGKKLFDGTLALIKQSGGQYIDSGYATKNHLSARLHHTNGFLPVYEEVTLHNWL